MQISNNLSVVSQVASPVVGITEAPNERIFQHHLHWPHHMLHRLSLVLKEQDPPQAAALPLDYSGIMGTDSSDDYDRAQEEKDDLIVDAPYDHPCALDQLFTPEQIVALMRFNNATAEQANYFGHIIKSDTCEISRNSNQLFTLEVADLLGIPPEELDPGLPRHISVLTYRGMLLPRLFGTSPCSMQETSEFVKTADEVVNFIAQQIELPQNQFAHIKPLLAYDTTFETPEQLQALTMAGYDCLARFSPDSEVGRSALDFVA